MGENVARFQKEFAAYFGMKHAVMTNSGSSANLIAVASLFFKKDRPLQRGDDRLETRFSLAPLHPQRIDLALHVLAARLRFLHQQLGAALGLARDIGLDEAPVELLRELLTSFGLHVSNDNLRAAIDRHASGCSAKAGCAARNEKYAISDLHRGPRESNSPIILTACNSVSVFVSTTYTSATACCALTPRSCVSSVKLTALYETS